MFKNGLTININEFENAQEAKNGRVSHVSKEIDRSITKKQNANNYDKMRIPFRGKGGE